MSEKYDIGIVRRYLDEFLALSVNGYLGEDTSERVKQEVRMAFANIDVWSNVDPVKNKEQLLLQLKMYAGLVAYSNPSQAKILMDAHELGKLRMPK